MTVALARTAASLADRIDDALPQTQCRRCGYADCRGYAEAIAAGAAGIDRCPPGGGQGIARLAALTGRPVVPLDPACGREAARAVAVIDEARCIGCTLCIQACPVDCIVGATRRMHTVVEARCTGCELCVPACPVDCIAMLPVSGEATGWDAWSPAQAQAARQAWQSHRARQAHEARENDDRLAAARAEPAAGSAADARKAAVDVALARARARRSGS